MRQGWSALGSRFGRSGWLPLLLLWALSACGRDAGAVSASGDGNEPDAGLEAAFDADGDVGADGTPEEAPQVADAGADGGAGPKGPAGQAAWLIDLVNERLDQAPDAEFDQHVGAALDATMTRAGLVLSLVQLRDTASPLRWEGLDAEEPDRVVVRLSARNGVWFRLSLATDANDGDRIRSVELSLAPDIDPERAREWSQVTDRLDVAASGASMLVARVGSSGCEPMFAHRSTAPMAVASAMKLVVLSAVAGDVAAGRRAWTDRVVVRDALKSLPTGELRDVAEGTELTLAEVATRMVARSDNTAADLLIDLVGRERVEAEQVAAGVAAGGLNRPFMTTREFFGLKLVADTATLRQFIGGSPEASRRTLDELVSLLNPDDGAGRDWSRPRLIDEVEWFYSQEDLCSVMSLLKSQGDEVLRIVGSNPGTGFDEVSWPFVGYKGGTEPGVLQMTWLLRHVGGQWYFVGIGLNDRSRAIDELQVTYLAQMAAMLLTEAVEP
jgi:hypothetical protein